MLMCDPTSGYNYGAGLVTAMQAAGLSGDDIAKVKIWNSGYPKEPEKGTCTITKNRSAIQNDDADQQTPGSSSRDMGSMGCVLIKGCPSAAAHRAFEVMLFQNPPGADDNDSDYPIRMVLSSYYWYNGSEGIPDGKSDCNLCTDTCQGCESVPFMAAYDKTSTGYDGPQGYTRVHRDAAIIAAMRTWMHVPNTTQTSSAVDSRDTAGVLVF